MMINKLFELLGPKIAVLGMGKSGQSVYQLLSETKPSHYRLYAFDDKNSNYPHLTRTDIERELFTSIVVSPGVPLSKVKTLLPDHHKPILINELDIASFFLESEIIAGITGSVGKSTTTALIGHVIQAVDPNFFMGGNIGIPLCEYAIQLIKGRARAKYVILEISSYQLENLKYLNFHVSAITALLPNHLERYDSKFHYYQTKLSISDRTLGPVVVNQQGGEAVFYLKKINALDQYQLASPKDHPEFDFNKLKLLGSYNHDNASAALSVLKRLGINSSFFDQLHSFPGLPHRLEVVNTNSSVTFINDSKATAIQSVIESVQTILPNAQNTIHLLLGGRDKKLDWERLNSFAIHPNIRFYFFGEARELIASKTQLPGLKFTTLADLLHNLPCHLKAKDVVLLSPGGTSLDEFSSFEHRGDFFKSWAKTALK
jgi:UDP-N-acetylmuramoylalanine--D-glutamate ligase